MKRYCRSNGTPEHAFIDVERGQYRCKWCAGALFLIRKLETDVKDFWKRALGKRENLPRIRSLQELFQVRRRLSNLSYTDDSGAVVLFDPHSFAHNPENKRKWGPRANSIAQQTGLLIAGSKKANAVKGVCQFCDKIVFSNKGGRASTVTIHAKCYQDSSKGFRKGITPQTAKPWRPVELENLRKHYSWAMRHNLGGESYGSIAKQYAVAKNAVVEGVKFIITHLPEPEIVGKEFRDRIFRLKSPEST